MRRMGAASIPGGAIQAGRAFSQLSTGKTLLGECPCSSLSHPAWLKLADAWCETGRLPVSCASPPRLARRPPPKMPISSPNHRSIFIKFYRNGEANRICDVFETPYLSCAGISTVANVRRTLPRERTRLGVLRVRCIISVWERLFIRPKGKFDRFGRYWDMGEERVLHAHMSKARRAADAWIAMLLSDSTSTEVHEMALYGVQSKLSAPAMALKRRYAQARRGEFRLRLKLQRDRAAE